MSDKQHLTQKRSLSAARAGFTRDFCHGLLEAHDSIRGVCISVFTLALPSSQHLVPKETCGEMSISRYSAAEQFAAARAASGYF